MKECIECGRILTFASEEGKNKLINVINNDFREILNACDRDKVRTR